MNSIFCTSNYVFVASETNRGKGYILRFKVEPRSVKIVMGIFIHICYVSAQTMVHVENTTLKKNI